MFVSVVWLALIPLEVRVSVWLLDPELLGEALPEEDNDEEL